MNAIAMLAAIALATQAFADQPNPDDVYITGFSYAGSGCPAGSAVDIISDDARSFILLLDAFVASAGPDISITENRKNCQLNIGLHVPQGWSYAPSNVDFRGYAQLDRRVEGTVKAVYYFGGSTRQATAQSVFRGPMDDDFVIRDTLGLESLVWSPCGVERNLNINTQVRVNNSRNRAGSGMVMLGDFIDWGQTLTVNLTWRRCQ
jgi:hypothetical protein